MPALKPPPRQTAVRLHEGRVDCPRCAGRYLDPKTLRCLCGAEFTPAGLEHWRSLPAAQALRT